MLIMGREKEKIAHFFFLLYISKGSIWEVSKFMIAFWFLDEEEDISIKKAEHKRIFCNKC